MASEDAVERLNPAHKLHLLSSAQYADKLLGEVEAILTAAASKSPFKKYKNALTPVQARVIEDYVARIRAQIVRAIEAQGIAPPEPAFESIHSIRVTLAFVRIAFQECTPDRMRGYGEVPESKIRELHGLVGEMVSAVDRLDSYLAQGLGHDLEGRLARLAHAGAGLGQVKTLERIINEYGFVEFRSTLSMIIDRLETKSFEIALFGRVSSGKSSLLNDIIQADVLPVGVNPITTAPTRLRYGPERRLTVWYADRGPESAEVTKLAEYVSEEYNPGNYKHVTRIVVELPSARLRDGVVFVDTPGLGSLASSGAAETLAYLPRCDLGVVLIDAGSTLTADDLSTIQALYDAGIPASVVLSRSDVLTPADRQRSLDYVTRQIRTQLGLALAVHPVSIEPAHAALLEAWLEEVMVPLFDRNQQLREDSLARKIGSLRERVETALRMRLDQARGGSAGLEGGAMDPDKLDGDLRGAVGRIAETRDLCFVATYHVRNHGETAMAEAARRLAEAWSGHGGVPGEVIHDALIQSAAEAAGPVYGALRGLARELAETLDAAARSLGFPEVHQEEDFASAIREMPRLDLGVLELDLNPGLLAKVSAKVAALDARHRLRKLAGAKIDDAFSNFGSLLEAWARRTLAELQHRFESHAETYRAHLDRLQRNGHVSSAESERIGRDLGRLDGLASGASEELEPASEG